MSLLPPDLHDKEQGVTKCDSLTGEVFLEEDLSMDALLSLWHDFSDVPINDWDEIEVSFMHFPAGTYRFDIWHWFDEHWPGGVYDLLFI